MNMPARDVRQLWLALSEAAEITHRVYDALSRGGVSTISHTIVEVDEEGRVMARKIESLLHSVGIPAIVKEERIAEVCVAYTEFTIEIEL